MGDIALAIRYVDDVTRVSDFDAWCDSCGCRGPWCSRPCPPNRGERRAAVVVSAAGRRLRYWACLTSAGGATRASGWCATLSRPTSPSAARPAPPSAWPRVAQWSPTSGRGAPAGPGLAAGHAGQRVLRGQGAGRRVRGQADRPRAARAGRTGGQVLAGVRRGGQDGGDVAAAAQPSGGPARAPRPDAGGQHARLAGADRGPGRRAAVVAAGIGPWLSREHVRVPGRGGDPAGDRYDGGRGAAG